jgi:hypothetical protein
MIMNWSDAGDGDYGWSLRTPFYPVVMWRPCDTTNKAPRRRRHGRVLVSVEVASRHLAVMERLALASGTRRASPGPYRGSLMPRHTYQRWVMRYGRSRRTRETTMALRNSPIGWAAFRLFRQTPAPEFCGQHGNWKHGQYANDGIASMRMLRLCIRILRGDLSHVLVAGITRSIPPGWSAYRVARLRNRRLGRDCLPAG